MRRRTSHPFFITLGVILALTMSVLGCGNIDDDNEGNIVNPTINLTSTEPANGGSIETDETLKMTFDATPTFVRVNGEFAPVVGNVAKWDVSGVKPGRDRQLRITWNDGVQVLTLNVLPRLTSVACIDFEPPLVLGTEYGNPVGHNPGDVVFTTNGIPVAVVPFDRRVSSAFNVAYVDSPPIASGSNQAMRLNNINLLFDFSGLDFVPSKVKFDYFDAGGSENLDIGTRQFIGDLHRIPASLGNVDVHMTTMPMFNSQNVRIGTHGTVLLIGEIQKLSIGGQEFWIDNVCVE